MNGLTVEIGNTDAEGRLVMADTMTYIQRNYNPKRVAYIATLTGSCIVALGKSTAGLFSTDDEMVEAFEKASEDAFEPVWHLPLNDEHRDIIKGRSGADLNNIGAYRWGGSSQAAAFLERFIEGNRPWVHLDIAGPVTYGKSENGDASGFGAKLLLSYIDKYIPSADPKTWVPNPTCDEFTNAQKNLSKGPWNPSSGTKAPSNDAMNKLD